ncbi:MAG: hypothetical protein P0Y65_14660 [Candidatus Devosia phytovorans]|uniref:Uncharacterized protein n=1 Tax=Candidatus Devosia phytovorans TaxID=3121372 RepID=A0AAJ6AZS8_9HYPH|nr:hypothetical protein [Devosia sp.]WEK03429.1 MAG: hypothetical protein P0Y65_14660 [Devosia sp.]
MRLLSALVIAATLAVSTTSHAADILPASETLLVGKTNIFCVQAPCPWRGIARVDNQAGPSGLLWSQETLPPLDAGPVDAARIAEAWNGNQCLSIKGSLSGGTLRVDEIIGACP